MSTFRVLHVIEAMHQGGAESLVVEHVRLAGAEVEPLVCALNRGGPALEAARAAGAKVVVLEKGAGHLAGLSRLARWMREERIDVVHGHNPTGGLYAALAGTLAGIRAVVRTEHSIHYPGRHSWGYALALEPLSTWLTRRVICVCEASRASHAPRFRWAGRRFVTVRNGISAVPRVRPRETTRAELGLPAAARVVLTVGSLTPQKAQHRLLEAMARVITPHAETWLMIAGEGPLRGALEARAAALGIASRVRWLGPRGDVADLIEACDLFALSSIREGLSVTLLEAMRGGRPAVVTRVGGNHEAVADGETGRVVEPGVPAAMAEAILGVLADPARAASMGAAARERWLQGFTASRMVAETEALYRAALGIDADPVAMLATDEECDASARA